MEICVYSEGAAALVLAEEETAKAIAKNTGRPVVWITGGGAFQRMETSQERT